MMLRLLVCVLLALPRAASTSNSYDTASVNARSQAGTEIHSAAADIPPYPSHTHHGPRRRTLNASVVETAKSSTAHNGVYMEMKRFDSPWNILGHVTKIFDPVCSVVILLLLLSSLIIIAEEDTLGIRAERWVFGAI